MTEELTVKIVPPDVWTLRIYDKFIRERKKYFTEHPETSILHANFMASLMLITDGTVRLALVDENGAPKGEATQLKALLIGPNNQPIDNEDQSTAIVGFISRGIGEALEADVNGPLPKTAIS